MEPVSLAGGIVGLVGTFTACVDCFEFVRIGCRLGQDYETSVLKLDIIRLRFTRWGEAVGIGQSDENIAVPGLEHHLAAPKKDFELIQRTLGQILALFQKSAEASKRFTMKDARGTNAISQELCLENVQFRDLHERMRNVAIHRQKRSTMSQKISWALHRKRDIGDLIEDLTELVSALTELVPAKPQQELCISELATMESDQDLVALDDILSEPIGDENVDIDDTLHKCVTDKIEERKGAMSTVAEWKNSKAGDGSKVRQGNNIAIDYRGTILDGENKYLVEDSELGKNVVFHQGNNYGYSLLL